MPECTIPPPSGVNTDPNCLNGGMKLGAVIAGGGLNLAAMLNDPALFDKTCGKVLGFLFTDPNVKFELVRFSIKDSTYSSEYTDETRFYVHLINMIFKGQSCEQTAKIKTWIENCGIYFMIWGYNCEKGRLFGVEYDSKLDEFVPYEVPLSVKRHKETIGKKGKTEVPMHELDLGGESECAALHTDISIADFKANYVS